MKLNLLLHLALLLWPFSGHAQWHLIDPLSESKFYISATAAQGKAFFVGGAKGAVSVTRKLEIYDFGAHTWSARNLSVARAGISATEYGGKVYCAGGFTFAPSNFDHIDVYDIHADTFGLLHLSMARGFLSSVVVGNKIMFAGGFTFGPNFTQTGSDVVDIYYPETNTWTVHHLSLARGGMGVAKVGNKVIFAGGQTDATTASDRVDIYDDATNQWTTATLSTPRGNTCVLAAGKYILVAGGDTEQQGAWDTVDIWDSETGTWAVNTLSEPRTYIAGAVAGSKAYFIGGGYADYVANYLISSSARVDIFDANTGAWTFDDLNQNRVGHAAAAWGNTVITAGGWRPEQSQLTPGAEIFIDSTLVPDREPLLAQNDLRIFPNPATTFVRIENLSLSLQTVEIFSASGQLMATRQPTARQNIPVADLPAGFYMLKAKDAQGLQHNTPFVKMN